MNKDRLVFDCNVYLQFLLNPRGPAGVCVGLALEDRVELFVSPEVLREIHELPLRAVGIERGLTPLTVGQFTEELLNHACFIEQFPVLYTHPIDPDDSFYVNLTLAANAALIVSNDKHLLNLTNPAKSWSQSFRDQYPGITIFRPVAYLQYCRQRTPTRD